MVIGQLIRGGAERYLYETAANLDSRRYQAVVYCLSEQTRPFGDLLASIGVPVRVLARRGHWDLRRVLALAHHFRSDKVDLVHAFLFYGVPYAVAAARIARVRPVIANLHVRPAATGRYKRWVGRVFLALSDRVLAVSDEVRDYVVDSFRVDPRRVSVILNAVDTRRFEAVPDRERLAGVLDVGNHKKVVLAVGRLTAQKRFDRFLETAREVLNKRQDVLFVIAGDGPEHKRLRTLATSLGIADHVALLGARDDVPDLLWRADLLAMTSDYEGFPTVALEALAAGTPVVATPGSCCQRLLPVCGGGMISRTTDPEELAALVTGILDDAAAANGMGRRGRRFVFENHSVQRLAAETQALYDELLGVSPSRPSCGGEV